MPARPGRMTLTPRSACRGPTPEPDGDALARLRIRWAEVGQSFRLLRQVAEELADVDRTGRWRAGCEAADGRATGWAEAPQGEVLYDVRLAERPDQPLPSPLGFVPQPGALSRGVRR